jgi:RES domain-containing protein
MLVYRIGNFQRIRDLQGTGGLYAAGRWHQKGRRILYTSSSVSLAKLEVLANSIGIIPKSMALASLSCPDDASILTIDIEDLPGNWNHYPYPNSLSRISQQWLIDRKYWVMKVPSAQSPTEYNYLFNPEHPMHSQLSIEEIRDEWFDARLKS